MRSSPNPIYRLLNKDYPENFPAYAPQTQDFYDLILACLPADWRIQREGIWFYCSPCLYTPPLQGWKIHLSATVGNSRKVLEKAAAVLFKYSVASFKFAVDRTLLSLLNSKSWPRGGAGKFITIYPPDSRRFVEWIEELDQATAGIEGPYVLSDQRYKNSRVVFYRYGAMRMHATLNVKGEKVPVMVCPDGNLVPDQRHAYPVVPAWATPVFPEQSSKEAGAGTLQLLNGRYAIETALAFSSAGGVYKACDSQTGKKVIVKEARPHIHAIAEGYDAVELLKKEYRLLHVVVDLNLAPAPIELFQEWEHWFLVQEFLEGTSMHQHSAANSLLLRTRTTEQESLCWWNTYSRFCAELIEIVNALHRRKIIFADLSPTNLIVTTDNDKLKIIDFEGAQEHGLDLPTNIYTPGFVSQRRIARGRAEWEDDYYSAGAVLLSYLLPINGLLHLSPQARRRFLASIQTDFDMPEKNIRLIHRLMDHPEQFCATSGGVNLMETELHAISTPAVAATSPDYQPVLNGILVHLSETAEYHRMDRLYPADPRVFNTNPLSLAYGAAGIAYAIHKITQILPAEVAAWLQKHAVTAAEYPPGLYTGMSGIAWSFWEMGLMEAAEKIFQTAFNHPLLDESPDLFYGLAGFGMAALRFFLATGNELYLQKAIQAGAKLLRTARTSERGSCWGQPDQCPLGLAHGGSGIGLFLLYLYLATRDERYLDAGVRALEFDLAAAVSTLDGGLSWSQSKAAAATVYPYWRFGSAGVGTALLRFQRIINSTRYASILNRIFIDVDRKYAVFPGRFSGLAGIGEFLLDLYEFTGETQYRESASKPAEGITHFAVERNGGLAFPGELLSRLCCDYGTGSAGIALFLNRLMGRQDNDFMLDVLFHQNSPLTAPQVSDTAR